MQAAQCYASPLDLSYQLVPLCVADEATGWQGLQRPTTTEYEADLVEQGVETRQAKEKLVEVPV